MTKSMYDVEASKIRHVYDPLSGRVRLVKGSGEILEQIVSKAEHHRLNRVATEYDGKFVMNIGKR